MPLYEYECKQCHQRMEKIQSFSAPLEKVCPKCGGELDRVISAPAIQFKGAGWYVNDYAKSGGKSKTSEGSESKAENQSGSASETKPESKTEGVGESKSSSETVSANGAGGSSAKSSSSGESSSGGSNAPKPVKPA